MTRRHRTPIAWFAALAIVLQALWPLLAHARPAEAPILVPLCTIDSVTHYLELKTGKQSPLEQRSANHGEHCKLCVFGAKNLLAIQPSILPFLLTGAVEQNPAPQRLFAVRDSITHPPAQPRAPPVVL